MRMRRAFLIHMALAMAAVGWALHLVLVLYGWLQGGPTWLVRVPFNRWQEGPWEIGVFSALVLVSLVAMVSLWSSVQP